MAHVIEAVQPHGVAYRRGIRAGDSLIAINGEPILDEIDYQALTNRQKLDVLIRRELWQVIRDLKGRATVILTTHYLEEAQSLSDRIGILGHGCLTALGTAEELMAAAGTGSFEEAFVALVEEEAAK